VALYSVLFVLLALRKIKTGSLIKRYTVKKAENTLPASQIEQSVTPTTTPLQ
jgi:hypothetical protein